MKRSTFRKIVLFYPNFMVSLFKNSFSKNVFLFSFILFYSLGVISQNIGDYRSNGSGEWTTASTWQVYNGTTWVTATTYPGQNAGTYDVTIQSGHTVSLSSAITTASMGNIIINGNLELHGTTSSQIAFSLNTTAIIVTQGLGVITFFNKVQLILPSNAYIQVNTAGLVVDTSCNHNQQILIGTIVIAYCEGPGSASLTFDDLMTGGGSINANIASSSVTCSSQSVSLSASYSGTADTITGYTWTVVSPSSVTTHPTGSPISVSLTENGNYTISLTYNGTYSSTAVSNTETLVIHNDVATWNGSSWSPAAPSSSSKVVLSGNYTTGTNGSFSCCSLSIASGKTLTVSSGTYVQIASNIINDGIIDILHGGSLVQTDDSAVLSGAGTYSVHKTTSSYPNYDYIYWSSPVDNETFNSVFAANPQSYIYKYATSNFLDLYSGSYTQTTGIPDGFDDNGNDWQSVSASSVMQKGVGYIVMGAGCPFPFRASYISGSQSPQSVVFDGGKVNNGVISVPVYKDLYNSGTGYPTGTEYTSANTNMNFIGNPYPSAIDLKQLKLQNTLLSGTFYFWTHSQGMTNPNGPNLYDFWNSDFAVLTTNGTITNTVAAYNGFTPSEYVVSGQGFMANVSDAGNISFNNSMRVTANNTATMRQINSSAEVDRVWLNLSFQDRNISQMLVGFHASTSDDFDPSEDASRIISDGSSELYSFINDDNRKLAIQMMSDFNEDKTIPVGLTATTSGTYKISVDHTEGIFNHNQSIYLLDNYTNIVHNLSEGDYIFDSSADVNINNRFSLAFKTNALATDEERNSNTINIYPNPSSGVFNISYFGSTVLFIEIYDVTGKQILKLKNENHQINLNGYSKGIYFAKIKTDKDFITKKIIIE